MVVGLNCTAITRIIATEPLPFSAQRLEKAPVAAAIAEWDAEALETAVTEADSIAGMVRTPEEWAAHPQSSAVDSLPLFEIIKIGDSDPQPMPDGDRPLSGIRVADMTRVIAGPMWPDLPSTARRSCGSAVRV